MNLFKAWREQRQAEQTVIFAPLFTTAWENREP